MKKFIVFVFTLGLMIPAGRALAESPVLLSHTITGYTQGADAVTLDVVLHVENPGAAPLYNLTLSYVPLMIIAEPDVLLEIGTIDANGALDIPLTIVTPMLLSEEEFIKLPLFWAGEAEDAGNSFLEFPADSLNDREVCNEKAEHAYRVVDIRPSGRNPALFHGRGGPWGFSFPVGGGV